MTREEEIRQAADKYVDNFGCKKKDTPVLSAYYLGYVAGAEWADAHQPSPWISVEDRLPNDNGKYYVLAAGIPDMALYKDDKWVTAYKERKNVGSHFVEEVEIQDFEYSHTDLTYEVTHWMPIPELQTTK